MVSIGPDKHWVQLDIPSCVKFPIRGSYIFPFPDRRILGVFIIDKTINANFLIYDLPSRQPIFVQRLKAECGWYSYAYTYKYFGYYRSQCVSSDGKYVILYANHCKPCILSVETGEFKCLSDYGRAIFLDDGCILLIKDGGIFKCRSNPDLYLSEEVLYPGIRVYTSVPDLIYSPQLNTAFILTGLSFSIISLNFVSKDLIYFAANQKCENIIPITGKYCYTVTRGYNYFWVNLLQLLGNYKHYTSCHARKRIPLRSRHTLVDFNPRTGLGFLTDFSYLVFIDFAIGGNLDRPFFHIVRLNDCSPQDIALSYNTDYGYVVMRRNDHILLREIKIRPPLSDIKTSLWL